MQINRIEFQAVGPFPGRHVIDVDNDAEKVKRLIDERLG